MPNREDGPTGEKGSFWAGRIGRGMDLGDVHFLAQELSVAARSRLPLASSLRALGADLGRGRLKAVVDRLSERVEQGHDLHVALEEMKDLPPLFASLVRAGEESGNLAGVLQLLCGHTQRMLRFRHAMRMALAYPLILLAACGLVMLFLLFVVLPEYASAFRAAFGREGMEEFPLVTRFWVGVSDGLCEHWAIAGLAAVGAVVVWYGVRAGLRRSAVGRRLLDRLALGWPFLGRLRYLAAMARFSRTLGVLLRSGVAAPEALELAGGASGSVRLHEAAVKGVRGVVAGKPLAMSLEETGFFGREFTWLVSVSEERGEPQAGLDAVAERYELELGLRERLLGAMASPAVVIAIGIVIASILAGMYLPAMGYPHGSRGLGENVVVRMLRPAPQRGPNR